MKNRALWVAHIAINLVILICMSLFTAYAVVEGVDSDLIGTLIIVVTAILISYAVIWIALYISTGTKLGPDLAVRLIFGTMPNYLWFTLGFLCFGGLATATWNGPYDYAVFWDYFSQGIGAALAVFGLGACGRFYKPNKFLGHIVGITLVGIVMIMALT